MATRIEGPLIVIVGETGSGKSALAIELGKKFNGEIIAGDSWTVYRGFDIGTAKPTKIEQNTIKHHLLDIAEPQEGFNAAEFKKRANQTIDDISNRGKLPILAGGSGLYIDSILFNYGFSPAGSPGERRRLNKLTLDDLQKKVKVANFDISKIDIQNKRRLTRLIETAGHVPSSEVLRSNTLILGLLVPKDELKTRITQRIDNMFSAGLENEVRHLVDKYGWGVEPMKGIGYREFRDYLSGTESIIQTRDRIISSTLRLAKKQRTWFKRNKSIHWVDNKGIVVDLVTTFLNK